jgi:endo-1,4-beta-xylanase
MVGGIAPGMPHPRAGTIGLWQYATAAGLHFGSASDVPIAAAPAAYASAFAQNCDLLAPNLGWHRTNPGCGDAPIWEDENVGFARAHGMRLTGAHLLWHKALPPAFMAAEPGAAAQRLAGAHIAMMGRHYARETFSWNVVNEVIDTDHGDERGLRRSPLSAKLGPGFIADAFHRAHEAAPEAVLTINETHLEMDTPRHEARRQAFVALLDRLLQDKAPIDAVGLQTHMRLDGTHFEMGRYRRFLRDVAARGVRILVTELDVFDIGISGTLLDRDNAVAAMYRDVLDVLLDEPAVASVTTWGLSDRYTWLTPATDPAYLRMDGAGARPLPLDERFRPKPAFFAIANALQRARPRMRA